MAARPALPARGRRAMWTTVCGVVGGAAIIHRDGVDFTVLEPRALAIAMFIAIPAGGAWLMAYFIDRWQPCGRATGARRRSHRWRPHRASSRVSASSPARSSLRSRSRNLLAGPTAADCGPPRRDPCCGLPRFRCADRVALVDLTDDVRTLL